MCIVSGNAPETHGLKVCPPSVLNMIRRLIVVTSRPGVRHRRTTLQPHPDSERRASRLPTGTDNYLLITNLCRDAVQITFDVDVDHVLPRLDAQVVEGGDRPNAGIVDENVKLTVPLICQLDEVG